MLVAAGLPAGQQNAALPNVQVIVDKVIERAKWRETQNLPAKYAYAQIETTEKFYDSGEVKEREERLYQVFPIGAYPYKRLIQRNAQMLSGHELQQEQERERKFRAPIEQGKKPKKDDGDFGVQFNRDLVSRYDSLLAGEEMLNGRSAYVLAFKPRTGDLPVNHRIDPILNKLEGKIWIDREDYEIAKADIHMTGGPVSFGYVLAAIRKLHVIFEQTRVDDAWLPSLIENTVEGRFLFNTLNRKDVFRSSDFHRATPLVAKNRSITQR
jgi:hypothetical protein